MKKNGMKKTAAALLCVLFLTGVGTAVGAGVEGWPEKTGIDPEGRHYVPTGDGRYEVWEMVGVFGSPEEAMKSLQPQEKPEEAQEKAGAEESRKKKSKKGKVKISKRRYKYELKQKGKISDAAEQVSDAAEKASDTAEQVSETAEGKLPAFYKTYKSKATFTRKKMMKTKKSNAWKSPKELEDLMSVGKYNQIFLQESKESGR